METIIKNIVDEILTKMGIDFSSIGVSETETNEYYVNIESDQAKDLIGKHGATLSALQTLALMILKKKSELNCTIVLDVDGYRKKQIESVKLLAERKVDFLRVTKKTQALAPMSPFFRKIVHTYLKDSNFADVETESIGNGEKRKVILKLRQA